MYSTSLAYKQAIAKKLIESRMVITITTTSNDVITITDSKIIPKSVTLSNKASKNSDFGYGSAYVGKFDFTILNNDESIDRYSLYGAKVEPVFYQKLPNNQEEAIPMGEFYVSEPKRSKKTIAITCYDAMTKFDVPQIVDTFGTPYELLDLLCTTCGVTLGVTEEEVLAMPNGTEQLTMSSERVRTCRDALSYISAVLCGFATINRSGALVVRQFGSSSVCTVGNSRRTLSTISDYQTYFIGIKARMLQSGNWINVTATVSGRTSGLMLDLGDLPVVQGVDTTLQTIAQTIADELGTVEFTPSDVSMTGDASIDLGDLITYTGVNNSSDSVITPVTSLTWKYHGVTRLVGEGGNAKLNAVTDYQTKQMVTLETDMAVNEYAMKQYTNSDEYLLTDRDTVVASLFYAVNKETVTVFLGTIPIYMALDGNVVFTYQLNGTTINTVKTYLERGWHAVTLTNYVQNAENTVSRLDVLCHTEYFESDKRRSDAEIEGLIDAVSTGLYVMGDIDTTIPTGTIPMGSIRAMVFASGMSSKEGWNGILLYIEEIGEVTLGSSAISVKPITDIPTVATNSNIIPKTITEQISAVTLGSSTITVRDIVDAVVLGRKVLYFTIDTSHATEYTYNGRLVAVVDDEFILNQAYPSPSSYDAIDSGAMKKCECNVSDITPSSMTIVTEGEEGGGGGSVDPRTRWYRVPKEYQEVEYIESTGTQYIDTGITTTSGTYLLGGKFMLPQASGNQQAIFGNDCCSIVFSANSTVTEGVDFLNSWHDAYVDKNIGGDNHWNNIIDGTSYSVGVYYVVQANIYIFCSFYNGIVFRQANARCKEFSIKVDGVTVRNLIPCYRKSDGVIGMYDTVNDVFYTNSGTGTFAKGGIVNHFVPSGYAEVEYIEATGAQWIDTLFTPTANTKVQVKFYPKSSFFNIGYYNNSDTQDWRFRVHNGNFIYDIPGGSGDGARIWDCGAYAPNVLYEFELGNFYVKDIPTQTIKASGTTQSASGNGTIKLSWWNGGDGYDTSWYYIKIYDSGEIVRWLIPCYRMSDGEVGMYDIVNNVFYTNAGSGSFSKGNKVYYELPALYQEVEYIESSNSQYINTGVTPSANCRFVVDTAIKNEGAKWCYHGIGGGGVEFGFGTYNGYIYYGLNSADISTGVAHQSQHRYTFDLDGANRTFKIFDGNTKIVDKTNLNAYVGTSNYRLYLCRYDAGSGTYNTSKVYSCQIYENGVLVRKFVPCYRKSDNVIGMYDLENDVFYTNAGSGTFSKGADTGFIPEAFTLTATGGTSSYYPNEGYANLFDNSLDTKWCANFSGSLYVEFQSSRPIVPRYYTLTTAKDTSGYSTRNPSSWTIYGKANAEDGWTTICTVTNDTTLGNVNNMPYDFHFDNDNEYLYFKFEITATQGANIMQLGEFTFYDSYIPSGGVDYKTLITDGTDVYSISSGTLTASIGLLSNLSATMFQTYGFDNLDDVIDAESDIWTLGEFAILRWVSDGDETSSTMLVTIIGVPTTAQDILTPVFSITGSNVTGIELTATESDGNPRISVKFDDGDWEYYDFTDEMWEEVGTGTIGYMTVADLENLTEEIWAEKFENATTMQTKLTLVGAGDTIGLVQYKFLQEE